MTLGCQVGMTIYNSVKACCGGIYVQFICIMKHVEQEFSDLDNLCFREVVCPSAHVHVSSHSIDRTNRSQSFKYLKLPDVARMNNQVGTFESFDCLRSQETVRVRDDTNEIVISVL